MRAASDHASHPGGKHVPMAISETLNALIDAGLQQKTRTTPPRRYLDVSRLGDACERRIQYAYLTPTGQGVTARHYRTVAMGHQLEPLVIRWLEAAGFVLSTRNTKGQPHGFAVDAGKIAGHVDGILLSGDESLSYPAVWECHTLNRKHWRECVKKGVALAHPHSVAQIQRDMAYLSLTDHPALLTLCNRDTAELHHERIPFDAALAQRYSDRAAQVLTACQAGEWLPRLAPSPDALVCKRCRWRAHCWSEHAPPITVS